MSENTYQDFSVVLEPANYNDSISPALILKTHTYKGEPSKDHIAKPLHKIVNINNINKKMFTPFHINIVNTQTNKILATTKMEQSFIHKSFIDTFCSRYNKCEVITTVKILINTNTFEPVVREGAYVLKIIKKEYVDYEVSHLFKRLIEEVPMDNMMKHKINIWVKDNL